MTEDKADPLALLEKEVIAHLFVLRPTTAAYLGLHEYDGLLPDLSKESTDRWVTTARGFLEQLATVPEADLTPDRRLDRNLLRLLLEGNLFDVEETRELDRNPMSYLFQPDLTNYIARDYAPVSKRVAAIVRVLTSVPALLEAAKQRLEPRLPRSFVNLSLQIANGLPAHFAEGEAFARTDSDELGDEVHRAREGAEASLRAFSEWLRAERLPQTTDDFALGRERYQRLLWVREGLTVPVDEVLRRGREDLKRNRDRLSDIARRESTSVERLVARLYENHPSAAELIPLTQRLTNETREFVREKELVSIPEPEVVHVRETPSWARDLWTAAMSPPGPFEKPVDGIYWVTSVDPAWSTSQTEGWLRTLNHAMLKNTTVHEVWPGHYLQSLHFHRTSQSLARKVWFSYSFIEGWAHYCEQAVLEAGFDGSSTSAQVTQLHDAMLRDCRLIVSIGMHTQGMSVADAARLLRTEAYLEEVHAQREAIRGTYNPEYFCYTLGKLAILDARSKYLTSKFRNSPRAFHDALLAFGTPPIGFLDGLLAGPESLSRTVSAPSLPPLPPPHTRVGVGGVLIRDGRALVNRAVYRTRFTVPSGYVEPGESLEAAVVREFEEETGVRVQVGPLLLTRHKVIAEAESDVYFAFSLAYVSGTPMARPPEIAEVREVPIDEALRATWISELSRMAIRLARQAADAWPRSPWKGGEAPGRASEAYHAGER